MQRLKQSQSEGSAAVTKSKVYSVAQNYERIDWHDWKFIENEKDRDGPGEQGQPVSFTEQEDIELSKEIFKKEGVYRLISEEISVNRSLLDTRLPECQSFKYLKNLPTVSAILVFKNDHLTLLSRTIHSIYNRSPRQLLREIIIVNDGSTKENLHDSLSKYITKNFDARVKMVNLTTGDGLAAARMEGAKIALGEVLVFLDAHMEVNTNWLPPLLEPIAIEPKTVTTPISDKLFHDTFEYLKANDDTRGIFDFSFNFYLVPQKREFSKLGKPSKMPVMVGSAFAVRKDFFLDLGGYDKGFSETSGMNIELSLRIWLCGGQMLSVPCSRVGHQASVQKKEASDVEIRDFKRIAEIWLGDYKRLVFKGDPERFNSTAVGDITKVRHLKDSLSCKPFDFFLEHIMPDLEERFPWYETGIFASGAIQSISDRRFCLEAVSKEKATLVGLNKCDRNLTSPSNAMNFVLSFQRQIKLNNQKFECLTASRLSFKSCHYDFGNQLWKYDRKSLQIINLAKEICLTANPKEVSIEFKPCMVKDLNQKWRWGYSNTTALDNWDTFGAKIPN